MAYKSRCMICKQKFVLVTSRKQRFVACMDCEMKNFDDPIEDKYFAKLFAIPKEWYVENAFLRSIKFQYMRFGSLTERQIVVFKETVKDLKSGKKREKKVFKKATKKTPRKIVVERG